jgi:hypothetical protein
MRIRYDGDKAAGVLLPVDGGVFRFAAGGGGGERMQDIRGFVQQDARRQPAQDAEADFVGIIAESSARQAKGI